MTDTQAVVDTTQAAAKPADTVKDAREDVDDLDQILAQYDRDTKPIPAETQPEPKPQETQQQIDPGRLARIEARLFQEDINEAVKNVFGEMKVPRRAQIGWLDQMARENPGVQRAFLNKDADPKTWAKFAKSLQKEAAKDFGESAKVDEAVTVDVEAVAAAVRGSSTKAPAEPAPELGRMTDAELAEYTRKKFGF